jgi:undecaprenyl-diphosphatase
MDFIQAVISGIVQGLTEFLPVSSTGHLVLASAAYKYISGQSFVIAGSEEVFFDIMLHLGTLVALLIYFKQDIVKLAKAFFKAVKNRTFSNNEEAMLPVYIVIGTIATAAIVLPFKDWFEADMGNPSIVGVQIMITGLLLFFTEFWSSRMSSNTGIIDWKKSIIIGLAQGIAVSPGISRSGTTIAAGLVTGLDRVTSARFSFLLCIPIIILAIIFDAADQLGQGELLSFNWTAIITGTVISAIVGYYCVKYFIIYLSKHKIDVFAYYCLAVGLFMFLFFR